MAKVTAPLLSFGARGQIAKTAVFADWRGVKYARSWVKPANPNTTKQQSQRSLFANLREIWKRLPADAQKPWNAFAKGRPLTGMNKMLGENVLAIGDATDASDFEGSPGALAGLPLASLTAATGTTTGTIDVTISQDTAPTDWTLASTTVLYFKGQDLHDRFTGTPKVSSIASGETSLTIEDLDTGDTYMITAWPVWTRPDGLTAYGPSLTTTAAAD